MNRNYKQILNDLPKDWSELKFYQYKEILDLNVTDEDELDDLFVGQENTMKLLHALTDIPIDELRSTNYENITPLARAISFINELPKVDRRQVTIKWKKIDDVTYDDFVSFQLLTSKPQETFTNFVPIIRSFSTNSFTEEEIDQLSMLEVYSSFFMLRKYARKLMRNTMFRLMRQALRQHLTTRFKAMFRNRRKN